MPKASFVRVETEMKDALIFTLDSNEEYHYVLTIFFTVLIKLQMQGGRP
jgi:hypothetical protein